MNIGDAVQAMRCGEKVARAGWNGKGMFIYLVQAASYPAQTDVAREHFKQHMDHCGVVLVPYREYVAMKTVDNEVVPWLCSQSDLLANDWEIV